MGKKQPVPKTKNPYFASSLTFFVLEQSSFSFAAVSRQTKKSSIFVLSVPLW
jgi:hypothetical protein